MRYLLVVIALTLSFSHSAFADLKKIEKLKAAYMFNFTKFIKWDRASSESINFCVQDDEVFRRFLTQLVESRPSSSGAPISIVMLDGKQMCTFAYIIKNDDVLLNLSTSTILISDFPDLIDRPSVFTFYQENNRLRFEINLAEAERLELTISSELLKVAKIK
ncbi:YfiR family protein [Alteromonas sp. 1_MG-2023]|uniref:YfiR family protein n=1 Tax=Alteromonas sp. 1_MG-2023 TaxID=3062669 RepID=UPI0026E414D8|nr:YfiR family protein [Alteromonas sp. 1_MG-2023]MDO6566102.1 YfiR family protein [Alteromonas sp. 1_MG-2023]